MGRNPLPTYSIIDSQSVKTTSASPGRGIDGRKTVKGRKRHIDRGHFLHVKVHAANTHDTVAGCQVFKETLDKYPSLEGVSAGWGVSKNDGKLCDDRVEKNHWDIQVYQKWVGYFSETLGGREDFSLAESF